MAALTNKGLFYTEDLSSTLRVAQVLGLTSTAFLAGKTFAASFTAPALLLAPGPLLIKQWQKIAEFDKIINPAISAVGLGVFSFFAYRDPNPGSRHQILYSTAAALLATSIPYSFFLLHPIVEKLEEHAEVMAGDKITDYVNPKDTTHVLVDRYATVNLGRVFLSFMAAATATWAAVDRLEIVPAVGKLVGGADRMGH
ncbi:hypothetical protein LTR27_006058 [Elasticomyces elasticus]|nr:hypothetical protein LTR27_006058 [Elasticomyces elasticus]